MGTTAELARMRRNGSRSTRRGHAPFSRWKARPAILPSISPVQFAPGSKFPRQLFLSDSIDSEVKKPSYVPLMPRGCAPRACALAQPTRSGYAGLAYATLRGQKR
jgi:hypothetical protein